MFRRLVFPGIRLQLKEHAHSKNQHDDAFLIHKTHSDIHKDTSRAIRDVSAMANTITWLALRDVPLLPTRVSSHQIL